MTWRWSQSVVSETFDVSHPYVFVHDGVYYMITQTVHMREVRLYRAKDFPLKWEYAETLVKGREFMAPSIIFRQGGKKN